MDYTDNLNSVHSVANGYHVSWLTRHGPVFPHTG